MRYGSEIIFDWHHLETDQVILSGAGRITIIALATLHPQVRVSVGIGLGSSEMRVPIIVNESTTPLDPGCIYVFSSLAGAERYFEAWYSDESYYACDVDGLPLQILPDHETGGVRIVEQTEGAARPDLAASFLQSYLSTLPPKTGLAKTEKSDAWLRSASVEEMAEVSLQYATW